MTTDAVTQKATNQRYLRLCGEARTWLVQELRSRGHDSTLENEYVTTLKTEQSKPDIGNPKVPRAQGCSRVAITPLRHPYRHDLYGLVVKIARSRRPIQYRRETENWKEFPWEHIIKVHLEDVEKHLASEIAYYQERQTRETLNRLARQEVPLPLVTDTHGLRHEELPGYRRSRNADGTYHIQVQCRNLNLAEARIIRDLVLAAVNRERETPLLLPKTNDTNT